MRYISDDNDQNQTATNSYQIVDRLNYASLEQNYQPHHIEEFKASALDPELVLLNITNLEGNLAVSTRIPVKFHPKPSTPPLPIGFGKW